MSFLRPDLLAETDGGHFEQARCYTLAVLRMRFGTPDDDDPVRFGRDLVEVRNGAGFGGSERVCLHRRFDRSFNRLFRHAKAAKYFSLPARRRSSVTSHRRYHDRLATSGSDRIDNSL